MQHVNSGLPHPPRALRPSAPTITAAALALAVLIGHSARADETEIATLRQQVQKLQLQLDELDANRNGAEPIATTPENLSPMFYAGPVKVSLSGFVELMGIARSRNESADWASNFNTSIPFPSSHNYDLSEFHLTERQSRIAALAQGPTDPDFSTEAYVETDFGGATTNGNNNQSSSFSPRVRHFYADYRNLRGGWYLLFGQTWSLVTAERIGMMPRQENIPLTIDGQYLPGFDWLRVPQVRVVKSFGDAWSMGLSAENPAVQVSASTTAPEGSNLNADSYYNAIGASNAFASTTNISTDYLPDIVGKAAFDQDWGHVEIFGLSRWFRSRDVLAGSQTNRKSHGDAVGASFVLPLVPRLLDIQASVLSGTGVGRYGSAGEPDATVDPRDGSLAPLHGYHALGGLVLRPASAWTAFLYGGVEHVGARSYVIQDATVAETYGYGYGSPLFSNSGCEIEGSAACAANTSSIVSGTVGGWWKFHEGRLGNMQLGVTDTYIRRSIYNAIGGAPSTNINIALLSFRYYPYQK